MSIVLFGDRITQRDLAIAETPISFNEDAGFKQIVEVAAQADITIAET